MIKHITRRTLLKLLTLPWIFSLLSCSRSVSLDKAIKEETFKYFLDVVFPAQRLGLEGYDIEVLNSVEKLEGEQAQIVARCYHFFKQAYLEKYNSFKTYQANKGEATLAYLLESERAEESNLALDILYNKISRIKALTDELWNREYSTAHKMCAYWDTYDEPIQ